MSWSPPHPTTPLVSLFSRSELTTVILNNYFGRQFNSLNDVAIHPRNKEMYFTDVTYGFLQDFRPAPVLPNQVYRFNPKTGLVGAVADGFDKPNGIELLVASMKTDFQVSHSRLMVLMPISPILVLRVVQKVRTLISPLPCKSTSSSSLYLAKQQLQVHSKPRRFMGKPPNIRLCRRWIPRWDPLRYQGLRLRWMWRRSTCLESCRSAHWKDLPGYR
jgi:hypothetical protein